MGRLGEPLTHHRYVCIHNHTLIIYDIICIICIIDWVACIIRISLYCYILIQYLLYYMINVYNHFNKVCDISNNNNNINLYSAISS